MNIKTCIFTLILPISAQAQVSIVNALPNIPDNKVEGWSGGASGSILWRDDNNRDELFNASLSGFVFYDGDGWSSILVNRAAYEWINNSEIEASFMAHTRLRLSLGKISSPNKKSRKPSFFNQVYIETFAQYEVDRFRALDSRGLLGLGTAIVIVKNDIAGVMVGTAYMFEYIDFTSINDELNHRMSNYVQIEVTPTDALTIDSTTFAQFRFDDFKDHVISSSVSLGVKAMDWFGIKLGFGLAYDSNPPPNIKDLGINISSKVFAEF